MKKFSEYINEQRFEQFLLESAYEVYQNIFDPVARQKEMSRMVYAQRLYMLNKVYRQQAMTALEAVVKFSKEFRELYDNGVIDDEYVKMLEEEDKQHRLGIKT